MPQQITNEDDAKFIAEMIRDGTLTGERMESAFDALESFRGQQPTLDDLPEIPDFESPQPDSLPQQSISKDIQEIKTDFADMSKDLFAIGEVATTIATAGATEITAGFYAALNTVLGGQSIDDAASDIRAAGEAFTFQPRSDRGKMLLEQIAPPLLKLEGAVDDFSEKTSFGNPVAATLTKTVLLGGLEFLGPAKGAVRARNVSRSISRATKDVKVAANDLGIRTDLNNMGADIVEAANRIAPEERALNAPALQQAMREANITARDRKNLLFEDAKRTRAFVETRAVRDLADDLQASLAQDFDLGSPRMTEVVRALDDLRSKDLNFSVGGPIATKLNDLMNARKRINTRFSKSPDAASSNLALTQIKRGIDDFLNNEFDIAAIDQGKSALSGETAAVKAWKKAIDANTQWKRNFSDDKAIANLIKDEATPNQIRQWVVGASVMGGRKQAVLTIQRMKQVLGDNHPAIRGIRFDQLFELAAPLLKEQPNFVQFVRNYESALRLNAPLMRELNLTTGNMRELVDFAKVQTRLPPTRAVFSSDFPTMLARVFVGHDIAKAGLKVNIFRDIARRVPFLDVNTIGKKQILAELARVKIGEPAIPKNGTLAAQFITGAALTSIQQ